MIHNNKVSGGPLVMFAAVKDDVGSLIAYGGSYPAGAIAYASDTNQIGWYDGTYWHWFGGSADEVSTDTTNFSGVLSSTDIDIQEALDTLDDHNHDGRYYTEAETDSAIDADISTHAADDDAHHAVFIQEDIDTLAELNAIVADATLDDSSDPRDPNAHALSHQHGGSDEIATATPAANAIPKADASGTLNAWLSGAGSGDMTKAVYDTDDDGVVDNAEALGGVAAANYLTTTTGYTQTNLSTSGGASVHWDNLTNVPTEFTPSQHDIVSATYHDVNGSKWDVVGLTDADTLGLLTPSADVTSGTEALLKSDASGYLKTAAFVLPDEGWVGNGASAARLLFDSSGATEYAYFEDCNVGIGTARPDEKLQVSGGNILIDYQNYLIGERGDGNNVNLIGINTANYVAIGQTGSFPEGVQIFTPNDAGQGLNVLQSDGTTSAFWVENDGNVGVNETDPSYKLDVNGDGYFGGTIYARPTASAASIAIDFNEGYDIYVDNAGAGSDNTRFWLNAPNGGEVVFGPRGGASYLYRMRHRATRHVFEPSGAVSEWIYIDADGLGFGRFATSGYRLDLSGNSMLFEEMTAPSAPAANSVAVFARDNGSGKTQLCARFATGAIQVLATEP